MSHFFVLVILMRGYNTFITTSTKVGPFNTPQSCLAAKESVLKRQLVVDAFCVQVDKD